MYDIKH